MVYIKDLILLRMPQTRGTYVQALYNYEYTASDGRTICIKEGDEFMLLKKANEDWWHVIKDGERKPIYVPASYVQEIRRHPPTDSPDNNDSALSSSAENPSLDEVNDEPEIDYDFNSCQVGDTIINVLPTFHTNNTTNSTSDSDLRFELPQYANLEALRLTSKQKTGEKTVRPCSPVYANLPLLSHNTPPPIPKERDKPVKLLPDDWQEYVDDQGRRYYFNRSTGESSWKPPRTKGSPGPKYEANVPPVHEYDVPTSLYIPKGWIKGVDDGTGDIFYTHETTKDKWLSSQDDKGNIYFFRETGGESVWELPEVPESPEIPVIVVENEKRSHSTESLKTSSPITAKRRTSKANERGSKTKSLMILQNKDQSMKKNATPLLSDNTHIPEHPIIVLRQGTLNKTKILENGKRIKKNWTPSFVILSETHLYFFKDLKSLIHPPGSPQCKPEISIDLQGAIVEWCKDKSSRRNVFEISMVSGLKILVQDDNTGTTKEWVDCIKQTIIKLPPSFDHSQFNSGCQDEDGEKTKLTRSKSAKFASTSSTEDLEANSTEQAQIKIKIKSRLKNFFLRRPTMESLRAKGILKEEPVFGCHLHHLCEREHTTVPKFIQHCIAAIEEKDMLSDGIYRVSGNLSQVQKLRFQVNQDSTRQHPPCLSCTNILLTVCPTEKGKELKPTSNDMAGLRREEDVHVLTGALKLFLRELREPLIPFSFFEPFIKAIKLPDRTSKLKAFKDLIQAMPKANYDTMEFLFRHLLRVTTFSEQNRMHVHNLAIVFGPALMWPEIESANIALDMMYQNQIVEFILLEFDNFFTNSSTPSLVSAS